MILGGYNSPLLAKVPYNTVQMDFEGADGGTNFDDYGLGKSTWTRSGTNVALSTTQALEGSSSLKIANGADYLETSYTADNRLPALGNWDFSIGFYVPGGGSLASKYILSIQGTAATGSDTCLLLVTNSSGNLAWGFSDGTTRTVRTSSALSTATWWRTAIERRGATLNLRLNGTNVDSVAFTGSLNFPSSRKIRIGKAEFAGTVTFDTAYFDKLRFSVDANGLGGA